jgi:hypothetical protein
MSCHAMPKQATRRRRAGGGSASAELGAGAQLVGSAFLLHTLNEVLCRTAVMVQPLQLAQGQDGSDPRLQVVEVPLPLPQPRDGGTALAAPGAAAAREWGSNSGALEQLQPEPAAACSSMHAAPVESGVLQQAETAGSGGTTVEAVDRESKRSIAIQVPPALRGSLEAIGLGSSVGYLRLASIPAEGGAAGGAAAGAGRSWVPLAVHFGVPLYDLPLCRAVCRRAREVAFLGSEGRGAVQAGQQLLQAQLLGTVAMHSRGSSLQRPAADRPAVLDLPVHNLLFDGTNLQVVDMSECVQGCSIIGHSR